MKHQRKGVNFLDLNVILRNDAISTDFYVELTDGHRYLHCKSSHPVKNSDEEKVQKVFSPPPMVSYRCPTKIKDCIVRSKLYPFERNVGCGVCENGRCQVCKNIKVTDPCESFTTKKSYKINHKLYCDDKCLIYL